MRKLTEINNLKNTDRYLIDLSNLKSSLIKYQSNFLSEKQIKKFYNHPEKGFPLLCPVGLRCFEYLKNNFCFNINKKVFKKKYSLQVKKSILQLKIT